MRRFAFLLLVAISARLFAADHAVILLYHHVSSDTPAITSVTPEQFEKHLEYIEVQGFNVIPLSDLLSGIYEYRKVPENAVALTFDDAYLSVYSQAFPRLRKRGWPFTVFVADQPVEQKYKQFMSWEQMREMAAAGVEFGGHSVSHSHLVRPLSGESKRQWRERVSVEIRQNISRIEEKLGVKVTSFAYPYGEFNDELTQLIEQENLYGLAQYSGSVGSLVSPLAIPRFPMMQSLGDIKRLALALNARPLPAIKVDTGLDVRKEGDAVGTVSFQLDDGPFNLQSLSCYSSRGEPLETHRQNRIVLIQLPEFTAGRNKINCTAASSEKAGEFFWFSHQWLVKNRDGSWPKE